MELDRLEVIIEAEAKKANAELDKMMGKLNQVSSVLSGLNSNGLSNLSQGIKELSSAMSTMGGVKTTDFNRLANNIGKLGNIDQPALYRTSSALLDFTQTMNNIGSISDDAMKIGELAGNISRLGNVGVQRAVANLPQLSTALKDFMTTLSSSPVVSQNLINMTNAMANLASQGSRYGSTVKGIASATNTLTKEQKRHTTSSFSLTSQIAKLAGAYFALKRAVSFVGYSIEKSMDYIETVNLFQTSLKKIGMESAVKMGMEWGSSSANAYAKTFIDRAESFNDMLVDSLTLDPELMKNYQAVFAQMTNSMNLVSDTSMNISETFTMLGNDIASLWNIDTDKAMKKLQSGLAGQIRPLRELGIDISKTSLEMYALNHGIEDSVEKMSQAAKVQLRYLAIMEQAEVAFGDMAKTIESPANQLRILSQQWTNLSRSIGNVFLPVVTTALPYINGLVIALRNMVDTLATAMGYEVPDYSDSNIYKDLTGDIGDMENVIEDATEANEKLRKSMMKWDELNILSEGKSLNINLGSGYAELDEAIQQKSDSYFAKFNEELSKMSNKTNDIAENIKTFFDNIGEKIEPTTKAFKKLWDEGLSKLAGYTWTNLKNFYTEFLSPIGTWVLGEGLPRLLEVATGLFKEIDWDKLANAYRKLYDALAPFVIGVGEGLILFIEGMGEILKPIIATTTDLLAKSVEKLAEWINKIPTEVAVALGGAIGGIATAVLLFKTGTAVAGIVKSIGGALETFILTLMVHPWAALGLGIAGVAGAIITLGKSQFDNSELGKFIQYLDDLNERVATNKKEVDELLKSQEERKIAIEDEYGAIQILADKYLELSEKENLSVGEKELLKSYSEDLIKLIPELTPLIDAETGAYKGTKDELTELITKTKEYYMVQAAKEDLIEIAKKLYQNEKLLAEQLEAREEIESRITEKEREHKESVDKLGEAVNDSSDAWSENANEVYKLSQEIQKLEEELKRAETDIETTEGAISDLNTQFSNGETYVKEYSKQVKKDMGIVKSSVSSALKEMAETVKKFTLPAIKIPVTIDDSNLRSYNPQIGTTYRVNAYATGGYPDMGQLFIAREAGPELVGNIGNRPAVANNDQIVQAVSQGVAMAVASVMGSGGGKAQVIENIMYLDGDVLHRSFNKAKSSKDTRFNPVMQGV